MPSTTNLSDEYEWQTFSEVNQLVEALSAAIIKKKLCPLIKSTVEGTPDLKMLAIFSENRPEWYITQLASVSDSTCLVPIAVE